MMFATTDYPNHYTEQMVYDSEWTDMSPCGLSWLSIMAAEPIPEEPDNVAGTCSPALSRTLSMCSTSSEDSCYVVLEFQRQLSTNEPSIGTEEVDQNASVSNHSTNESNIDNDNNSNPNKESKKEDDPSTSYTISSNNETNTNNNNNNNKENETEDEPEEEQDEPEDEPEEAQEEEEEEEEEVIEELNIANMIDQDDRPIHYEQITEPMIVEIPIKEHAVEYKQETMVSFEQNVRTSQPKIQQTSNDILFDKAKSMTKISKRMKIMSYASIKERNHSPSSNEELPNVMKLKTIRQINEYYPTAISTVSAEHQATIQPINVIYTSTASLDSIDDNPLSPTPAQRRPITTFSNLSPQRMSNQVQNSRSGPAMGTATLTRTFAFDRACMEKYVKTQEPKDKPIETTVIVVDPTQTKRSIEVEEKPNQQQNESSSDPESALNCRSFINTIRAPSCRSSGPSVVDDSEFDRQSSIPPMMQNSNTLSRASSLLCLVKKCAKTVKSECRTAYSKVNSNKSSEPTLINVKYFDGRLPLHKEEVKLPLPRKKASISDSICSRLNRLGLKSMSSTQDLSSTAGSTSFSSSYRKRMYNRFRLFVENNFNDLPPRPPPSSFSEPRPWQHKTINELLSGKKYTVNRCS